MTDRRPDDDLRQRLTPLQYQVTQCDATEPPFQNAYWDEHREGIYVDVVSGEPLFAFGHGLSYTTFEWGPVSLSAKAIKVGEPVSAQVQVTNTGSRTGSDGSRLP